MAHSTIKNLFAALIARLGKDSATQEYRWMKQAAPRELDLVSIIRRRLLGEPLQYILGT